MKSIEVLGVSLGFVMGVNRKELEDYEQFIDYLKSRGHDVKHHEWIASLYRCYNRDIREDLI